jgi:ligand-binding SRPBCC domain-containing protein
MHYELTDHFIVRAGIEETWSFFSDARNLPRITPAWLKFTVDAPGEVRLGQDSMIEYTIRWMGVPVRWKTRIIDWTPPRQFIDLQIKGPYALWHHQHTYAAGEEGTICTDRVLYKLPGWLIGRATHAMVVRRQLLAIFRHRRQFVGGQLGWVRGVRDDVEIRAIG